MGVALPRWLHQPEIVRRGSAAYRNTHVYIYVTCMMTVGCIHVLMFRRHGFSLRGRVLLSVDNHVGPVWWVGVVITMYHVSVVSVRLDYTFEYIRGACSTYSCFCHEVR